MNGIGQGLIRRGDQHPSDVSKYRTPSMRLSIIVAMTRNRVIGKDNDMPWHLPAELRHFKRVTMGKPIVMGRRTFDSIGRVLPGRKNIVITRDPHFSFSGVTIVHSFDAAVRAADGAEELMIIGGANLYRQTLDRVDRLYITLIHVELEGDTYFSELDDEQWIQTEKVRRQADENNAFPMTFLVLERKVTTSV